MLKIITPNNTSFLKVYRTFLLQRKFSKFVTEFNNFGHIKSASCPTAETQKLDKNINEKILFSSIIEDQQKVEYKLGYKRKKIFEEAQANQMKKERINNISVKPFSAALKAIGLDTNVDAHVSKKSAIKNYDNVSIEEDYQSTVVPANWMDDYEFFEGSDNVELSRYGTIDPNTKPSKIPCSGCGANLHCADTGIPGFIPSEIFKGRTDEELKRIICQRCHFLKNYNVAVDVVVKPEDYVETLSSIKDTFALAVLIVDLLDFPCSIWSEIQTIIGDKRPVIVVGNKVDLLPKDSKGYLHHIKNCLNQAVIDAGLNKLNLKQTCLVSAKTGYGIEELINQLHKIWRYRGDVYLIGCANVGKSSIFNALLRSDYCKVNATELVKRATTCPWPGTTLKMLKFPILRPSDIKVFQRYERLFSERAQKQAEEKLRKDQLRKTRNIKDATLIGQIGMTFKNTEEVQDFFSMPQGTNPILTLNENSEVYAESRWCFDTPGVINPDQIHNLLTTEELLIINPQEMVSPRAFRISQNMSIFLSGIGRLDYVSGDLDYVKIYVFSSMQIPILLTHTKYAEEVYSTLLGTEYLGIPYGNKDRLKAWPNLESSELLTVTGTLDKGASSDIVLSSVGWISISLPNDARCKFLAWTPKKRGIFIRQPALVQYCDYLCGKKVRRSLAYKIGKPFVLN